ncbi:MAG: DEAD/DEAH box helicase [Pyrinomonadaceae bacterium]
MNFDSLLSRVDDETLQIMLGAPSVRLITLLNPSLATPAQLREVLLGLRTRASLLISKASRVLLFDLLRPKEAEMLVLALGISDGSDNVYDALKSQNVPGGSQTERTLFEFFELTVPEPEVRLERPSSESSNAVYPLFTHQRTAARAIKESLSQPPRRVLLHMPTGSGKTRTAMNVVADHLRNREPTLVIWLAHNEELCEQAATEFQKAWRQIGDREVFVYRFWGAHELNPNSLHEGLVVAGLSKVYNAARRSIWFIDRLGQRCSMVVMDEAHQAIAATYKLVLDALVLPYPETALLGLTATPGRTWSDISADEELSEFFARRKVTLQVPGYDSPVDYLVAEGYLAKIVFRSLLYRTGITLSASDLRYLEEKLDLPRRVLESLVEDEQRNLRIISEVEQLATRHSRILVFAASVEHSALLATVLRARGSVADSLTGETNSIDRERLIRDFKDDSKDTKILCNFGVLTTGFDAPRTSAAVIARPTQSLVLYSQMVGRASRGVKAGGNDAAEIVTVVDTDLPGFQTIAEAFSNWDDVWRSE